jgi:hypothetical protein
MKIYIAGPISGLPIETARANFQAAEEHLRKHRHTPINPLKLNHKSHDGSWQACMRVDIRAMMNCDGIYPLAGWEQSKGAYIEMNLAAALGMTIFKNEELVPQP